MPYAEFIKEGQVIFRQTLQNPLEITEPGAPHPLTLQEGDITHLAGLQIRICPGLPPADRSNLTIPLDAISPATLQEKPGSITLSTITGHKRGAPRSAQTIPGAPVLHGFEVRKKLGEGGMGSVWHAIQLSTNREVAIKTMTTERLTQEELSRFALEIEVTAQLDHPHIGRLYESHLDANLCYYAMEFIDGRELEDFVQEENPSQTKLLGVMLQVCRAVQYAHQKGIIHRDLKPGNIMVTYENQAKVVDFGIAKLIEENHADQPDSKLTTEGMHLGTPAYMSPEQIQARPEHIDTRTDVYALGVILYEQLVGAHPHGLDSSTMVLFMNVLRNEPTRPRSVKPTLSSDTEAVLLKALARNPDERYASAGELADDLQRLLDGEPVLAQPQTALYVMRKKVVKHKGKVLVGAAAMMAFVAYVAFSFVLIVQERDKAHDARDEAQKARTVAEQERDKAEERFLLGRNFAHALIFNLDRKLEEGATAARAELISNASTYLESLSKGSGSRPDLLKDIAEAYSKIGEVQRQQGDLAEALKSYQKSIDYFDALRAIPQHDANIVGLGIANNQFYMGRATKLMGEPDKSQKHYSDAETSLQNMLAALRKTPQPNKSQKKNLRKTENLLVQVYQEHGKLLGSLGDQNRASAMFHKALEIRQKRVEDNPKSLRALDNLAKSHYKLTFLSLEEGLPSKARGYGEKSLELRQKLVSLKPSNQSLQLKLARSHCALGLALQTGGLYKRANLNFSKAQDIFQTQATNDPSNQRHKVDLLWSYIYLSGVSIDQGDLYKARTTLDPALTLARKLAKAAPDNAGIQRLLARTLMTQGRIALLKKRYPSALEKLKASLATTSPMLQANAQDLYALELHGLALTYLGSTLHETGKLPEGEETLQRAITDLRALTNASPDDHSYQQSLAMALLEDGLVALDRKEYEEARKATQEASVMFQNLVNLDSTNTGARNALIRALTAQAASKPRDKAKTCLNLQNAQELYQEAQKTSLPANLKRQEKLIQKSRRAHGCL